MLLNATSKLKIAFELIVAKKDLIIICYKQSKIFSFIKIAEW
ncbi:hypothetical protein [Campylobacter sp. RM12651]|nr:hypothetical protein [Campylobacter sp. RM12651]